MKNSVVNSLKYYILKEKNTIFLLLGISMISSGIAVIQPLLMQKFIDSALLLKNIDNFYYFVSLIIIVSIFSIVFSVFLQYNYTKLSIKVLYSLRIDIFEKIFLNKKLFFQKYRVGDLLSRIEGDISELQRFGIDSIFALFSALLGLIGALIIMFFFDITLAIFALVLFPLEFFLLKPMYSKMHDITKDVRQSSAIMGSFIIESLRYVNFLKKTNAVKSRKDSLVSLQDINKQKILEQQVLQIKFTQIPVIVALLARVSLIIFGGLKVIAGEITVGELIAFLSYFSMVLSPVHTILGILNNIPKLKVSMQRLEEITPKEASKKDIKFLEKNLDLELKNITFSYPHLANIFEDLNLKIKAKEKVVLLGKNGIGKTTLIELLTNNLALNKGEILLGGININQIENETFQNYIGLVEQNPVVLNASLKENLLIAKKDSDKDILIDVLDKVGLLSWYENLENGLNTILSEDGQNLSGGQKQRLAIARLVLQKPSILIMDEPTSALDKDFIKLIDSLIDENFKDSTKIIISHLDCYKNARYLKIEEKQIKEYKHE